MNHINNEIESLIKNVLDQAKYYLDDAGEFYPFGAVINEYQEIKPVSVFLDKEYPATSEVLDFLMTAVKNGIKANDYLYAAICIDVYINVNKGASIDKNTAVEIRIFENGDSYNTYHFLYQIANNAYVFSPLE